MSTRPVNVEQGVGAIVSIGRGDSGPAVPSLRTREPFCFFRWRIRKLSGQGSRGRALLGRTSQGNLRPRWDVRPSDSGPRTR